MLGPAGGLDDPRRLALLLKLQRRRRDGCGIERLRLGAERSDVAVDEAGVELAGAEVAGAQQMREE